MLDIVATTRVAAEEDEGVDVGVGEAGEGSQKTKCHSWPLTLFEDCPARVGIVYV